MALVIVATGLMPALARADDRTFRLSVPDALIETGLMKHLLPRFSLKTGVRIELVPEATEAEITLSSGKGRPVFSDSKTTWHLRLHAQDHAGAARFADWLNSEVGQRTLTSFEVDGTAHYTLPDAVEEIDGAVQFEGNAVRGRALSVRHCGRCHVVSEDNRMNAIGSTPSFFVLRAMSDWDVRFQSFYALNPHPAFTQIAEVTKPFPIHQPPPIIPVEITLDDLEAILAYVSDVAPADLGAPLVHQ
ncbi:hypothetical protein [Roseovarius litorisediminis]|uniref:hypothetical protein n=1 Tax=Roseovarius litorisediminis TaxID=1312363 RepID=UPI001F3C22B4|nr:hypothetical protein [Roseovarius litorisediminis]